MQVEYSPVAALNSTFALAKANGNEEAITEAEKLRLNDNHLYHILLADLYKAVNPAKSLVHLVMALSLAKTITDKKLLRER